jgi:putative oxidoreductase
VQVNLGAPTSKRIIRMSGDYCVARLKRAMTINMKFADNDNRYEDIATERSMTDIATAPAQRSHSMLGATVEKLVTACAIILPYALVAPLLRLVMARIFFLSGQTKIEGPHIPVHLNFSQTDFSFIDFSIILPREIKASTFQLFETQSASLPVPPALAAYLLSYAEFVLPICLLLGFATRFAALALLIITVLLALYVAPALWWPTQVYWAAILLTLVSLGPGAISIDALVRTLYRREGAPLEP